MRSYNATSPADWSAAGAWHTVPWSPVHGLHGVAAGATGPGAGNSSGSTGDSRDSTDISSAAFGGHSPAASTTPSQDGPGSRSGTTSAAPSTPTSPTSPTSFTSTAPTATTAPDLGPSPIGWLKSGIPYLPPTDALQLHTLDVWVPNHDNTSVPPDPLSPSSPAAGGTWIVYIHGGAWRDPFITSASFAPAAGYLLHHAAEHAAGSGAPPPLAGLVSINYRLSPHPSHPAPGDPSRQARHPDHIADVLAALSFLGRLGIIKGGAAGDAGDGRDDGRAIGEKLAPNSEPAPETNWILAGHSCGATLAFQAVMHPARWDLSSSSLQEAQHTTLPPPRALVGFNGLYDLAGFVSSPPPAYAHLRDAYREFTTAAFGGDEAGWRAVCPASAGGQWVQEWVRGGGKQQQQEGKKAAKNKWSLKVVVEYLVKMILGGTGSQSDGKKATDKETKKSSSSALTVTKPPTKKSVVLVQSREDSLVPWDQIDAMHARLADEGGVDVTVVESDGDHDDAWKKGGRMADILWGVVSEKKV
ncbi:Alpha/Beta hydrolase protein [Chaetomium sp. MPI-SDFR-AT-0129]|nr:Alpha/Beta hydrolase protein [Chaetomium sp. MPI-SDFR-AT-0129]